MKNKQLVREHCASCEYKGKKSNTWYFEYNPDWHGMKVYQRACTECGFTVVLYEHNETARIIEEENIKKELEIYDKT